MSENPGFYINPKDHMNLKYLHDQLVKEKDGLKKDRDSWKEKAEKWEREAHAWVPQVTFALEKYGKWRSHAERLAGALGEFGKHDDDCLLSRWQQGRTTADGGYEMMFGDKWYQVRPIDNTPECECGLDAFLTAHAEMLKEKK